MAGTVTIIKVDTIFASAQSFPANSIVEIQGGVKVQFQMGVTFGDNCKLILKDGSTLRLNPFKTLKMFKNCILDARNGILDMKYASCFLDQGSIFMLENYIVDGGKFIASYYNGDIDNQILPNKDFGALVGVKFEAPIRQVFSGAPRFEGKWLMPAAHPEWFCPAICDDWSVPINTAINFIEAGNVVMPPGRLNVKHSILVKHGIVLQGTAEGLNKSTYKKNYNTDGSIRYDLEYGATTLCPRNITEQSGNTAAVHGFSFGCVILVNINPEIIAREESDNITYDDLKNNRPINITESVNGEDVTRTLPIWESQFPKMSTTLKNFVIRNQFGKVEYLRGIFFAGSGNCNTIMFRNLHQCIAWADIYSDSKVVEFCTFENHFMKKDSATGDALEGINRERHTLIPQQRVLSTANYFPPEYDLPYAVDFGMLGDGVRFMNNAMSESCINGLRVHDCGGGIFSGNIINCDVQFESSKGITFSGNHMEYGAQLRIIQSQIEVSDNMIQKGSRESIVIASGRWDNECVVSLSNNIFEYYDMMNPYDVIENSEDVLYPVCDYDVALFEVFDQIYGQTSKSSMVESRNNVMTGNNYRYWMRHGQFGVMYTFGVKIDILTRKNVLTNSTDNFVKSSTVAKNPFSNFNNRSHYLSAQSQLLPLDGISGFSYSADCASNIVVYPHMVNQGGKWELPLGSYRYATQVIYDLDRGIVCDRYTNALTNPFNIVSEDCNILFTSGDTSSTQNAMRTSGMRYMVRIVRERIELNSDSSVNVKERWKVDVPVCGSSVLYDNGTSICGYKWASVRKDSNGKLPDFNSEFIPHSSAVARISIEGGSFRAYINETIPSSCKWKKGDVLLNISETPTWQIKVINKDS